MLHSYFILWPKCCSNVYIRNSVCVCRTCYYYVYTFSLLYKYTSVQFWERERERKIVESKLHRKQTRTHTVACSSRISKDFGSHSHISASMKMHCIRTIPCLDWNGYDAAASAAASVLMLFFSLSLIALSPSLFFFFPFILLCFNVFLVLCPYLLTLHFKLQLHPNTKNTLSSVYTNGWE